MNDHELDEMEQIANDADDAMQDDTNANAAEQNYAWEEQYKRSWDIIQEDSSGTLTTTLLKLQQQLQKRRRRDAVRVQRGILRHVVFVLDWSAAMADKEFKPSMMGLTASYLKTFMTEFFDQVSDMRIILIDCVEPNQSGGIGGD